MYMHPGAFIYSIKVPLLLIAFFNVWFVKTSADSRNGQILLHFHSFNQSQKTHAVHPYPL